MDNINTELVGMLFGNEDLMKVFNKDSYADAFHDYCDKYAGICENIEAGYESSEDKQGYIKELAGAFTAYASGEDAKLKKKSDKEHFLVDHNSVLTVYMLPALNERETEACGKLAEEIIKQWNAVFTRYTIKLGTFAEIDGGFKRKLCYITTAVCESLGRSDDCYELKMLRDYRDEYLMNSEDGAGVVRTYYNIAPTIVNRINKRPDSDKVYCDIFKRYIKPCITLIENDRKEECRELYSKMVYTLKDEYL